MKNMAIKILYRFLIRKNRGQLIKYGRFFGALFYYLLSDRRKIVKKNLEIVGADCGKKSVKKVFENNFISFFELFLIPKIDEQFLVNCVDVVNEQEIRDFIRKHKKNILVSAHIGCWELSATIFSQIFKTDVAVIGKKIKNQSVNDIIVSLRKSQHVDYLQHRNILKNIYSCLANNVSVGVLLDQSARKKDSIFVDFFGLRTAFNASIAAICVRKDIPALPCFCIRENGKIKFLSYPPIFPDKKLEPKSRVRQFIREINIVYEDVIRKYPEQWLHLHKRFKRTESADGTETYSIY
jgi:KDO2-lipid IV(A) lauroyltransferase